MSLASPDYQELFKLILAKAISAAAARDLLKQGYTAKQIARSCSVPPIA